MKMIRNIVIFDNDNCFIAMMKGYCYANNIMMTVADFNADTINKVEKLKPVLIVIPLEWAITENKNIEKDLLMRMGKSEQITICGLIKNSRDIVSAVLPRWIDMIINNPLDIGEIDQYLKEAMLLNRTADRRLNKERRSKSDRRLIEFYNNVYVEKKEKETRNSGYLHETVFLGIKNFQIDQRNKCVLLKGHKVDLTPKEYELFELLSTDVDRVFTADEIIKHLWPESDRASKADLYQHMHLIRKKVENDPNNPQWIVTVKGFGYKLNIGNLEETNQSTSGFF